MRRLALRWRLTLTYAVVMAILLTATGGFVHQRLRSDLDGAIDATLRARTADVSALAQQSDSALREDSEQRPAVRGVQFAQLIDTSGRVLDRTPGLAARPLLNPADLRAAGQGRRVLTDVRFGDDSVRLSAVAIDAQDQQLVVVVGQSLQARDRALQDLSGVLLLGGPLALLAALLAGYRLTGAALHPVEDLRRQAEAISAAKLDERLATTGRNDELGRLGQTLNDMLARVQSAVAHERTFVADASHELRSPLAMLRTELELIARDAPTGPELQRAVRSAIDETGRLSQLADDLLLLTRADEQRLAIQTARVPVCELLDAAAARARRQPRASDIQITVEADTSTFVVADRARIAQALDNLLANSIRYATAQMTLSASTRAGWVELHVLDDGPGFPPAFLPTAWTRFSRADFGRTADGAGLGLSIVQTIAELHGGTAEARNLQPHGADVWLTLPHAT